ncbi:MAG TPA: glutamate racemase, partial [Bacteroidales bacterium]|nr:glutamate racemase [Bacteroidales bacterium]
GGLSVFKELKKYLPSESFIYFADSINAPYGSKTSEEILELSEKIVKFLLVYKVKLIVVACNTVTAHAIKTLRENFSIPFVGMEPAVKPAALNTKTKHIGVLATAGTLKGNHFAQTTKTFANGIYVHTQVGEGLVQAVESGDFNSQNIRSILQEYIVPMVKQNIDHLVLGCTHYPFLCNQIKEIIGQKKITIINPAEPVALHTKNLLRRFNLQCNTNLHPRYQFFTTGEKTIMEKLILQTNIKTQPEVFKIKPL